MRLVSTTSGAKQRIVWSVASQLAIVAATLQVVAAQGGGGSSSSSSSRRASSTITRSASASSRTGTVPLAAKTFSYPDGIPYKVDTDNGPRGTQQGYNVCNSTTEGPESLCQTAFINSIEDFCLWGPPEPNSIVGNTEGEMVAWCTKPGRGTRLIPAGALKGVQFTRAPAYLQVVGFIDQTQINIQAGDYGGEMDPHGADQRGNPLGGLLFSAAFGNSSAARNGTGTWTQAVQWHNFMGADMFCLKACVPGQNDWRYCEHIYDRIGCAYNAPADYRNINGTFQSCDSDNQMFPGVYVGENGRTSTYTQPPESLGVISTIPYVAEIPSSSQCTTYDSASLWTGLPSASTSAAASSAEPSLSIQTSPNEPTSSAAPIAGAAGNRNNAAVPTQSKTGAAGARFSFSPAVAVAGAGFAGLALLAMRL